MAVALLAASACSGDDDDGSAGSSPTGDTPTGQFGGELEGTEAQVGIAAGNDRVTVYVCDDGTISEWFITDAPAAELTLASRGGAVAALTLDDDEVTGTITLADGSEHEFRAKAQPDPVIHRAEAATEDDAVLAGWVTVGDRTTGAISANPGGGKKTVTPAPAIPTTPVVSLPAGDLSLSTPIVTITGDSTFVTANRTMTFVVGGVGDSYASGEGNPLNAPMTPPSSPVGQPTNLATMWGTEFGMNGCHRSDDAGIPRAFRALKTKYPGFDMRLAFVACGGSQIEHVTGRPNGGVPAAGGTSYGDGRRGDQTGERTDRWEAINERAQLQQLDTRVRDFGTALPVDLLAMSIGGNDAGFAPTVGACVAGGIPANVDVTDLEAQAINAQNDVECDEDTDLAAALTDNGPAADNDFVGKVPGWNEVMRRYAALDATLEAFATRQRAIGQVVITHYGAGLKNTDGSAYCGGRSANTATDLFGFIDTDEAAWIDANLIGGLNAVVDRAVVAANTSAAGPRWKTVTAHVGAFANHGPCAAQPWTHINATGLAAQGNNLPGLPDDSTRSDLAKLNTILATAKGTAIGCVVGVIALVVGCAVGAAVGLIVGLATNEAESAVTAGMAHPNRLGWHAIGDALFPEFDAAFQRTFTPLPASRARQFGARENSDIVVRWDDRSSTETRYELEVFASTNTTTPVKREANLPANAVEYTFKTAKPFVGTFRVRACNVTFCSPFTPQLKITNIKPGVPTNLSALNYVNQQLGADLPPELVVVATDPKNADTATRIELTQLTNAAGAAINSATPRIFNVPAPFPSMFNFGGTNGIPVGQYRVRAASCNVFGCSGFGATKNSSAAPPGPPKLKLELLPPFVVDQLGLARPRGGPELPGPGSGGPTPTVPGPNPSG